MPYEIPDNYGSRPIVPAWPAPEAGAIDRSRCADGICPGGSARAALGVCVIAMVNGTLLLIVLLAIAGLVATWNSPEAIDWLLAQLHVRREMIPVIRRQRVERLKEREIRLREWREKLDGSAI